MRKVVWSGINERVLCNGEVRFNGGLSEKSVFRAVGYFYILNF